MVIHSDGTYSTQQLDANSASGTGMTSHGAAGFEGLGRSIPDGQGGTLVTVSFPPALYHASSSGTSKFPLPITPPSASIDAFAINDAMLLGEDSTAYLVGSSDPQGPMNTLLALDTNGGAIKWTTSPGLNPTPSTVTSDGSVAFQYYSQSDFSQHLGITNSSGQVSPLFANPADGSDVGPLTMFSREPPSYWALGTWHASLSDGGLAAVTGLPAYTAVSAYPENKGSSKKRKGSPRPQIAHFITRNPGNPPSSFTVAQAVNDIKNYLSGTNVQNAFYTGAQGASIDKFLKVLQGNTSGIGFIGDSALVSPGPGQGFPFSIGLCFYPSEPTNPPSVPPNCLVRTPDDSSPDPLMHFGNIVAGNPTWRTTDKLPVNLKLIFIGSCEDGEVFNQWWQISNSTVGHVLIVPSNPTAPTDLVAAISEWEDIVKYSAGSMNVGEAITQANANLVSQGRPGAWKPIGDPHVCISTTCKKSPHSN